MADFRPLRSMAHDDDQLFDMAKSRAGLGGGDLPEFPPGLCFTVREANFDALGIEKCDPGDVVKFAAFARATSVSRQVDACRVEAEIDYLSLGDGEMAELDDTMRPSICLDESDHERLDLNEDVSQGDMVHLIGMARVNSVDDTPWGGKSISLQITHASVENESTEKPGG